MLRPSNSFTVAAGGFRDEALHFLCSITSGFFLFCACVCSCGLVGLVWTHVAEFNWRRRQQHLLPAESANSGEALQPCPPTASIEARVLFTNKQFCFQMTSRPRAASGTASKGCKSLGLRGSTHQPHVCISDANTA